MPEGPKYLRLLRGSMAATLATGVALLGHVLGGGDVPALLGVAVPWWLSVTLGTVLGSRSSLPRLSASVLGSQALFHLLFVIGTPADPSAQLVNAPGMHLQHGAGAATGAAPASAAHHSSVGGATHVLPHASHLEAPMMLGHLLAAAATIAVLHRGESALLGALELVAAITASIGRVLRPVPSVPSFLLRRLRPLWCEFRLPRQRLAVLRPLLIRGPPQVLAS